MGLCQVTEVRAAKKDQGKCGKCGQALPAGSSYRWWKGRFGPKHVRCVGCKVEDWERETNPLRAEHMQADETLGLVERDVDVADPSGAAVHLRDAISATESIVDTLTERLDGWSGTGLENSEQYSATETTRDELQQWIDDAESAADELEGMEQPDSADDEEAWEEWEKEIRDAYDALPEYPPLDLGA
jgi:hypothetical protein